MDTRHSEDKPMEKPKAAEGADPATRASTTTIIPVQEAPIDATVSLSPPAPQTVPVPVANPVVSVEDVGNEDEYDDDDLDDLDDLLDEFDAGAPKVRGAALDEDWAKMLQEGMTDLLNDGHESPEMQNQFEKLAKELNDAMAVSGGAGGGGGGNAQTNKTTTAAAPVAFDSTSDIPSPSNARADATNTTANFQDRIMQTMERMKTSNAEVDAGLAEPGAEDFLSEMLKQMGGGGENSGEEDFSNMLVNMMEQLTSKEILYEPMKELFEKYPEWLRKNEGKESQEDMDRYRKQFRIVKEIVTKFDEPGYRDEDESQREYIIERMQMMQTAGAPPTELMGDMNPGQPPDPASDCAMQ